MPLTFDLAVPPHLDARSADRLAVRLAQLGPAEASVLIVRQASLPVPAIGIGVTEESTGILEAYARLTAALRHCPLPTLAVAEGPTSEAVAGVFAAADIVLAARGTTFEAPCGARGVPAWGIFAALAHRVGVTDLREWSKAGQAAGARAATSWRLVDERIIGAGITARTASWARALAGAPEDSRAYLRHRFDRRGGAALPPVTPRPVRADETHLLPAR